MLYHSIVSLLLFFRLASCGWPLSSAFAYWFWQSSIVVDNFLYIDGGEFYNISGNEVSNFPLLPTISVDLSTSWTISNINGTTISKPSNMNQFRRPVLWYDTSSAMINKRDGWPYTTSSDDSLWSLTPDGQGGGSWSLSSSTAAAEQLTFTFGAATISTPTNLYMLGGEQETNGYYGDVSGLTVHNFAEGSWNNNSDAGALISGRSFLSQAVYAPNFGTEGVMIVVGGGASSNGTNCYECGTNLVPMSNITIYDIASGTWYQQTATGTIPPPRSEFCADGSPSLDNSTYEIFVFGGSVNETTDVPNPNGAGYLDIYILTLPAFTWVKASTPSQARRANHNCQVLGKSQMIFIGGRDPSANTTATGLFWPSIDPWTYGMNIYDMNALQWTGAWNASREEYNSPSVVKTIYSSGQNKTDWSNQNIENIFATHPSSSSSSTSPTTNSTPSATPSPPPSSSSHAGAIAGGVIGGLAALALVGALLFFFLVIRPRRTRRAQEAEQQQRRRQQDLEREQKHKLMQPQHELSGGTDRQKYELAGSPGSEGDGRAEPGTYELE